MTVVLGLALAFGLGACSGTGLPSGLPTNLPSMDLPTLPPDGGASGTTACIDTATLEILDDIDSASDREAFLRDNKDTLLDSLNRIEFDNAELETWRAALIAAAESDDADALVLEASKLAGGIPIPPVC